jgi:restriction endonuclease S subunit
MKDSGIEWIGDVPEEWEVTKFYRVCSVITDFVASGSFESLRINVPYHDYPDYAMLVRTIDLSGKGRVSGKVYISKHSYDFLNNSNLFGGEIILPNIGASVGDVYIVPNLYERMSLAPNSIMFKTKQCDKYWYYYFYSEAGKRAIFNICQSTAQPKFNKTELRDIRVCIPTNKEQQAIADYLDKKCSEIDSLIELQEQMIEELKAYKQSVITEAVTKGLNPKVPMKDSGIPWIGDVPEEWEVKRLKYAAERHSQKVCDEVLPYIGLENIESFSENFIETSNEYDINQAQVCSVNDVIFGKLRPYLGKAMVVKSEHCCSSEFLILRGGEVPSYLRYLMLSNWFIEIVNSSTYGTKMPRANSDFIMNMKVAFPPAYERKAIADYLDKKCGEIDELITIKQQKIESLKEYKKSVIYEYVTGKREV